ncbi:hypothetical protein ABK646_26300 [Klebsiella pneumoniae]|uniref:hypothetical protein n=1 Tax=Klebsiella pneumoniae TaxID=573 RepID=UPI0037534932
MSSKNTLPSVDLMSCQHGGEVIPSIAIERIISLRDEGILHNLPQIITAVAALITAITGLIKVMKDKGKD